MVRVFSGWMSGMLLLHGLLAPQSLVARAMETEDKEEAAAAPTSEYVIGIDLGTTYSCVGVMRGSKVDIISNRDGSPTTPSWVGLDPKTGAFLKGEAAKNLLDQCDLDYKPGKKRSCVAYDSKRLIGRSLEDPAYRPVFESDRKHWPFRVEKGPNGGPLVHLEYSGGEKTFAPEELSAQVLIAMKDIAEDFLDQPVRKAVITVPAYFTDAQRQATKDAGKIAGLEVLRIINEPTAAAMAYGFDKIKEEKKLLVYDLGGGTFDVSVLSLDGGVFEVVSTTGDGHLGGQDFDNRIVDWIFQEVKDRHRVSLADDPSAPAAERARFAKERTRVIGMVEHAKKMLSSRASIKLPIPIGGDKTVELELTRAKFESLCMDLFRKTITLVEQALKDAKWAKSDIDEVVLVGGSTRIPKVQELLSAFFGGKRLNKSVNPDEAVAYGAAIQGAILTGNKATEDLLLIDVTPLSLGIETMGGVFTPLIPRNTPIPTKKTQTFSTAADNQSAVNIRVLEGERGMAKHNHFLGSFDLTGIPPAPRGMPKIEVTFDVDVNGILTVDAAEIGTGKRESIKIKSDKGRLTAEQIEKMIKDAELHREEDERRKKLVEAKDGFERYLYNLSDSISKDASSGQKLSTEDRAAVTEAVKKAQQWLEKHGSDAAVDLKDFDEQRAAVEKVATPVIAKLYPDQAGAGGEEAGPEPPEREEGAEPHDEL